MSVFHNNALIGASGQGAAAGAGYEIERSLRFNSADSAYLNRTPSSAGNRKTWTYSVWVKRSELNTSKLFRFWSAGVTQQDSIYFNTNDTLQVYLYGGSGSANTLAKFRDTSAWYHIVLSVDTTQATTADRIRIYVNGEDLTNYVACTQNLDCSTNLNALHTISTLSDSPYAGDNPFDGYLADAHFIDGQALDPTDFGEFDDNNVWQPIAYTGSYGTNGFHLPFSDNSSASALGTDDSGNGNNWTVNNISVASGEGNDSLLDSPTNGDTANDTGAGGEVSGNWAVWNPLSSTGNTGALSNGNLDVQNTSATYDNIFASFGMPSGSGSYYWEFKNVHNTGNCHIGIAKTDANLSGSNFVGGVTGTWAFGDSGFRWSEGTYAYGGAGFATTGMIVGIVFNSTTGVMSLYRNGTLDVSITGITDSAIYCPVVYTRNSGGGSFNFGQRPFAHSENVPSGAKLLCSTLVSTPTIEDGSTAMDVVLWNGTSASQDITGFSFSPDLAWIKSRTGTAFHIWFDTVRGATKGLASNSTLDEASLTSSTSLSSFNSDGFTVISDSSVNNSAYTYVGWAWDAGSSTVANTDGSISSSVRTNGYLSIVSYTGNGVNNATVGHGLGTTPSVVIVKSRDGTQEWIVYHSDLTTNKNLLLNTTNAEGAWNEGYITLPTSTTFRLTGGPNLQNINTSTHKHIAYCFAPVEGYSAFGSYTGNGSATDGPFVYTGHRTRWLMVKRTDSSGSWWMWDTERDTYNLADAVLRSNSNVSENTYSGLTDVDILSNGFKWRGNGADVNASGGSYVFMSFAENPFKYARAR